MRDLMKIVEAYAEPGDTRDAALQHIVKLASRNMSCVVIEKPNLTYTTLSRALTAAGRHVFLMNGDKLGDSRNLAAHEPYIDLSNFHEPTSLVVEITQPLDQKGEFALVRAYDEAAKTGRVQIVLLVNDSFNADHPGVIARYGLPTNR
jgi:hypothetical protein